MRAFIIRPFGKRKGGGFELDFDKAKGVNIHRLKPGKDYSDDAKKALGENPVYFALRDDAFFLSVGECGLGAIKDAITETLKYDAMIIIESVQLENIEFSANYLHSIEQRMLAEVEVQKLQQNAEREKVQAQITVTQATAKANAVRAEAQANAEATRLNGEASASNIKITGEAQAAAIEARAKALGTNPNLVTLVQAERWNGVLPTTMVPGSAVPFVSIK